MVDETAKDLLLLFDVFMQEISKGNEGEFSSEFFNLISDKESVAALAGYSILLEKKPVEALALLAEYSDALNLQKEKTIKEIKDPTGQRFVKVYRATRFFSKTTKSLKDLANDLVAQFPEIREQAQSILETKEAYNPQELDSWEKAMRPGLFPEEEATLTALNSVIQKGKNRGALVADWILQTADISPREIYDLVNQTKTEKAVEAIEKKLGKEIKTLSGWHSIPPRKEKEWASSLLEALNTSKKEEYLSLANTFGGKALEVMVQNGKALADLAPKIEDPDRRKEFTKKLNRVRQAGLFGGTRKPPKDLKNLSLSEQAFRIFEDFSTDPSERKIPEA